MKSNVVNCYICYRKKEISVKFNVPNKDAIKYRKRKQNTVISSFGILVDGKARIMH